MPTKRFDDADPAVILGEHRAIRATAEALEAHIRGPVPSPRAHWLKRLAEEFDALAGLLRPHFAREEAGGMFDAMEARDPGSARECARLRDQHGTLLDRLVALERRLHAPRPDAKSVEVLRRGIRGLLADLAGHEEAENALLVRVMEGEEVGAPD